MSCQGGSSNASAGVAAVAIIVTGMTITSVVASIMAAITAIIVTILWCSTTVICTAIVSRTVYQVMSLRNDALMARDAQAAMLHRTQYTVTSRPTYRQIEK